MWRDRCETVVRATAVTISTCALLVACAPHRDYSAYDSGSSPGIDAELDSGATVEDTAPAYPEGPYGVQRGNVFPNVTLDGYRAGGAPWTTIAMSDYYDPDGGRGINALFVTYTATWCPPCNLEASAMPGLYAQESPRGVRFLDVLNQNDKYDPPTQKTADEWLDKYALPFDLAIDPAGLLTPPALAFPSAWFIDPRTMVVVRVESGANAGPIVYDIEQVLKQNGAPPPPDGGIVFDIPDGAVAPTDSGSDAGG